MIDIWHIGSIWLYGVAANDFVTGHDFAGGGVCTVGVFVLLRSGVSQSGLAVPGSTWHCTLPLSTVAACGEHGGGLWRGTPRPPSWRVRDCFDETFTSCDYLIENGVASAQLVFVVLR